MTDGCPPECTVVGVVNKVGEAVGWTDGADAMVWELAVKSPVGAAEIRRSPPECTDVGGAKKAGEAVGCCPGLAAGILS
eukprot:CAMPEP_0172537946 /NCGR_PEP_ID=MMETSP1067-20121228/9448_1 /TAXON_ID=265564 ORGANISM="Thalassiosira punctigera, Strain Tpunct2005C2" /NCGR_SAMPLE_ID=MMETSP1067 /ASSEMBLY_ACC=CAM_ASM_000444 /LENGTH=78 /DNA_ID=CAMNT_0013323353 /DNA_START=771 /DNA_END=1007 /DNA_ORIENTATION=+